MIGGCDFKITGPISKEEVHAIVFFFNKIWESGLYVEAFGLIQPIRLSDETWKCYLTHEFFIHKDRESYESWEKDGLTESNNGTMVHVIIRDSITIVVDKFESELAQYIRVFIQELYKNRERTHANSKD